MNTRRITRDGSYTLYSDRYKQTFHSVHGSKTEALHVFLEGSGIRKILESQRQASVLEVGFGTGFNFFLTADLADRVRAKLSFSSLEQTLLDADTIASLGFEEWLAASSILTEFISWRKAQPLNPDPGLLSWNPSDSLSLHLLLGEATQQVLQPASFDAIFLDAFSPDQNPELWTIQFFEKLYHALKPGCYLATYSAKSMVRKNLMAAGFDAQKLPGPPGKREMLVGLRNS